MYKLFGFNTVFYIGAEEYYFLGNKGQEDCPGGVSIKDEMTCEIACTELGVPLAQTMSDGFECYKSSGGKCRQDGGHGIGASFV